MSTVRVLTLLAMLAVTLTAPCLAAAADPVKIGYRPVCDVDEYRFERRPVAH